MLRLGWAAGTSRSYAIPLSRALRLAATGPWPPSPDSPEPAMGKTEGEKLYQWQLCHHHHSTHVQTLFCTVATDSSRSNTPSGVDSTQLCHQQLLSSAEHLLCLHDLPHLPRIATILHTQPAANNPSATRCEAAKGPGGGRREEVTCARRREARAAVSDSAEISTCVTKHNSKHVNPSIRQWVSS